MSVIVTKIDIYTGVPRTRWETTDSALPWASAKVSCRNSPLRWILKNDQKLGKEIRRGFRKLEHYLTGWKARKAKPVKEQKAIKYTATQSVKVRIYAFRQKGGWGGIQVAILKHLELVLRVFKLGRNMVKIVFYKHHTCCSIEHGLEE